MTALRIDTTCIHSESDFERWVRRLGGLEALTPDHRTALSRAALRLKTFALELSEAGRTCPAIDAQRAADLIERVLAGSAPEAAFAQPQGWCA